MAMPVASNNSQLATPKAASAYARSRTLRLGVWMLGCAAVLIAWHAVKDGLIAKPEALFTVEGVVLEHRSRESSSAPTRVRLPTGGTSTVQGSGSRKFETRLRIQKRDGTVADFTASEGFPTPKAGWQGQPTRVQHDARGNLYEIVVAGEVVRDVETSRRYRKIDAKANTQLWVFLVVLGVPLVIVGFLLSLRRDAEHPRG